MKRFMVVLFLAAMVLVGNVQAYNFLNSPPVKAVDWNIVRTTTEAQNIDLPTSGVYSVVGAKTAVLSLVSTATLEIRSILYYQSNGTKLISTETLTVGTAKTLLTPYFKFRAACSSLEVGVGTGEVYILGY